MKHPTETYKLLSTCDEKGSLLECAWNPNSAPKEGWESSKRATTSVALNSIPLDTLQAVLLFLDFPSALALTRVLVASSPSSFSFSSMSPPHPSLPSSAASPSCADADPAASAAQSFEPVWREQFRRLGFAPDSGIWHHRPRRDALEEILYRRRLRAAWSSSSLEAASDDGRHSRSNGQPLPLACYSWIPALQPPDDADDDFEDSDDEGLASDPCLLLAPTTSECLHFDRIKGTLSHRPSGWEEGGETGITRRSPAENSVDLRRRRRSGTNATSDPAIVPPPVQLLLEDNAQVSLSKYCDPANGGAAQEGEAVRCFIWYKGMVSRPTQDGGLLVAHARTVVVVATRGIGRDDDDARLEAEAIEVHTWFREPGKQQFGEPRLCCFRDFWSPWSAMEVDADHRLLYVAGVVPGSLASCIRVYQLVPVPENDDSNEHRNHRGAKSSSRCTDLSPLSAFDCGPAEVYVSCLARWDTCRDAGPREVVENEESLLAGTDNGRLYWCRNRRLELDVSVSECLLEALRRGSIVPEHLPVERICPSLPFSAAAAVNARMMDLQVAPPHAKRVGVGSSQRSHRRPDFVTLHHDLDNPGGTVLLWTECSGEPSEAFLAPGGSTSTISEEDCPNRIATAVATAPPFRIEEIIQLPLSSPREPKLHYDGHRLVVYGRDRIGFLVLIYAKSDPVDNPESTSAQPLGDGSGGVLNLSSAWHLVREIRHEALGGHPFHEPLLVCNERYAVVSTQHGHRLLSDESCSGVTEGLLVIDFEEAAAEE